ncbi:unnamed protein product [Rotaria sp. Silwood2]|nr:unnamed protein product [Rotaria sp. Silwood2]CAF3133765.1 unnamed protein product [Rotaria sp. Silwood2]
MFHDKIRTRVITTHEGTQCVIDDYLKDTSNEMVALLPNFKHIKRNIQRQRKKNDLPQVPQDKHFTMIPTILTITLRKDIFLQFDSGPGDNRLELGFKNNYETDSKFANNVNKIAALAFLKPTDVHQGFNELYLSLPPMFQPLMDYFEDTYLGRRCPNGRATPRYPIELWNMYQRTIDDSMRTNNLAEVWHRRFNSVDQFQHPSLWIFI